MYTIVYHFKAMTTEKSKTRQHERIRRLTLEWLIPLSAQFRFCRDVDICERHISEPPQKKAKKNYARSKTHEQNRQRTLKESFENRRER